MSLFAEYNTTDEGLSTLLDLIHKGKVDNATRTSLIIALGRLEQTINAQNLVGDKRHPQNAVATAKRGA